MWHLLSGGYAICQRKRDAVAPHGSTLECNRQALTAKRNLRHLRSREFRERLCVAARHNECVTRIGWTHIEKRDDQSGLKYHAGRYFMRENLAEDATHVRLTRQMSRAPR
jgi:hypothetical protein